MHPNPAAFDNDFKVVAQAQQLIAAAQLQRAEAIVDERRRAESPGFLGETCVEMGFCTDAQAQVVLEIVSPILRCPSATCRAKFKLKKYSPRKSYSCKKCGSGPLKPERDVIAIEAALRRAGAIDDSVDAEPDAEPLSPDEAARLLGVDAVASSTTVSHEEAETDTADNEETRVVRRKRSRLTDDDTHVMQPEPEPADPLAELFATPAADRDLGPDETLLPSSLDLSANDVVGSIDSYIRTGTLPVDTLEDFSSDGFTQPGDAPPADDPGLATAAVARAGGKTNDRKPVPGTASHASNASAPSEVTTTFAPGPSPRPVVSAPPASAPKPAQAPDAAAHAPAPAVRKPDTATRKPVTAARKPDTAARKPDTAAPAPDAAARSAPQPTGGEVPPRSAAAGVDVAAHPATPGDTTPAARPVSPSAPTVDVKPVPREDVRAEPKLTSPSRVSATAPTVDMKPAPVAQRGPADPNAARETQIDEEAYDLDEATLIDSPAEVPTLVAHVAAAAAATELATHSAPATPLTKPSAAPPAHAATAKKDTSGSGRHAPPSTVDLIKGLPVAPDDDDLPEPDGIATAATIVAPANEGSTGTRRRGRASRDAQDVGEQTSVELGASFQDIDASAMQEKIGAVLKAKGAQVTRYDLPSPLKASGDPKYMFMEEIAFGGMGAVVKMKDRDIRRPVAMKIILNKAKEHEGLLDRFIEEAQVTGQLEHPNIVPVHEFGTDQEGRVYFTMKYIRGRSLEQVIAPLKRRADAIGARMQRSRPEDRVRSMARAVGLRHIGQTDGEGSYSTQSGLAADELQEDAETRAAMDKARSLTWLLQVYLKVCDAVAFAHSKKVIHRDLKAENIMIGDFGEVLVTDWGVAKVLWKKEGKQKAHDTQEIADFRDWVSTDRHADDLGMKTVAGQITGTPAYMPPEQARGRIHELDERSDIYSLGAMLYEILTLEIPYDGPNIFEILKKVAKGGCPTPRECAPYRSIPAELEGVVQRAMAHRKEQRYQSVGALTADITAFLEGRTLQAVEYTTAQRAGKWVKRNRRLVAGFVAAVVMLIVGSVFATIWFTTQQEAERVSKVAKHLDHGRELQSLQRHRDALQEFYAVLALEPQNRDAQVAIQQVSFIVQREEEQAAARNEAAERLAQAEAQRVEVEALRAEDGPEAFYQRNLAVLAIYQDVLERLPGDPTARQQAARCAARICRGAIALGNFDVALYAITQFDRIGAFDVLEQGRLQSELQTAEREDVARRSQRVRAIFAAVRTGNLEPGRFDDYLFELVTLAAGDVQMVILEYALESGSGLNPRQPSRSLAIQALGRIGEPSDATIDALMAILADPLELTEIRIHAGVSLGNIGATRAEVVLLRAMDEFAHAGIATARLERAYARLATPVSGQRPTDPQELLDMGEQAYRKQDYQDALRYLRQVRDTAGDVYHQAHYKLGLCYLVIGNSKLAFDHMANTLSREPDHVIARVQYAFIGGTTDRLTVEAAIGEFELAQQYVAEQTEAARNLADPTARQKALKAARDANVFLFEELARFHFTLRAYDDVLAAATEGCTLAGTDSNAARCWLYRGQARYHRAIARMRADGRSEVDREEAGQIETAISELDTATQLDPMLASGVAYIGQCRLRLGQTWMAEELWSAALSIDPNDPDVALFRGQYYYNRQEYEKASHDFRVLTQLRPLDWLSWFRMGGVMAKLYHFQEAVTCYLKATSYAPTDEDKATIQPHLDEARAKAAE